MALTPDVVLPTEQLNATAFSHLVLLLCIGAELDCGLQFHTHRRRQRRLLHFFLTRPLHTHALPRHMLGQPRSVIGHIVCTVVSITACTAHMLHFNLLCIHTKRQRQIFAQWKNTLRVTPHFQTTVGLIRFPNSQRHTGPHRAMVQSGPEINRLINLSLTWILTCFWQLTRFMKHLRVHRGCKFKQINTPLTANWQTLNIPL